MNKNYCYIHIPFCESKCKYCRFASVGNLQKLQIQNYVNYLSEEIINSHFDIEEKTIKSVYFGGGTPSTLNKEQFSQILNSLKEKYAFDDNIEISIESTPQNITENNLGDWLELGVNRISIGIQSLNNKTLKEIGRKDNSEIFGALDILNNNIPPQPSFKSKGGSLSISVDFIIGLPYVEKGGVKEDIENLLEKYSFINHISVYMLEDYYEIEEKEEESKFQKITYPNNWNKLGINEEDYLYEYLEVKKYLETKGVKNYELSNFSQSGKECKHNKAYWNHSNVLSFGLGASGYIDNTRYSNSDSFKGYYSKRSIFTEKLKEEDIFLEKIMFGLRTSGLEQDVYKELDLEKIKEFIEKGLLYFDGKILKLGEKGTVLLDYIIGEIIN